MAKKVKTKAARNGYRMLSARVSHEMLKAVNQRALDEDTSSQAVVRAAIAEYLKVNVSAV